MKRSIFLKKMAFGLSFLACHPEPILGHSKCASTESIADTGLIKNIRLMTAATFDELTDFYVGLMGLIIMGRNEHEITFNAGHSTITFEKTEMESEEPWYHFAFNIPENKIIAARKWLLPKIDIIPTPTRARDPNYPDDVRHFRNWNAHSLFFWDPAGNLLEFIARHDLKNGCEGEFSTEDILNVSEIAFVVDDQQSEAHLIQNKLGLSVYPKDSNFWWSMGDENGLLLCIPKRLWGENTDSPKRFGVHKTMATLRGSRERKYLFPNFPYEVDVEP